MTTIHNPILLETSQEKYERLMAEHLAECGQVARTGIPRDLDVAKFQETLEAFKAINPPREQFPQPFPLT